MGIGFRVKGLGYMVQGIGLKVEGAPITSLKGGSV